MSHATPAAPKRLYAATRKGLFTLEPDTDAGGTWKVTGEAFIGDPVSMVLHDERDDTLYAALDLGHFGPKLHRSDDGGETWEECPVPTYPEKPPQSDDDEEKDTNPWTLKQIWSLETGGPDEAGVLWAGTLPGGLFRSADRGGSWTLIDSLWNRPERKKWFGGGFDYPGIHSVAVDPRNPRHLLVAVSCAGVWRTEDGGDSWEIASHGMFAAYMPPEMKDDPNIQDPHRMVRCAARPDVLWVQHHNGVFRSVDNSRSWHEVPDVPPSVFGFAVAVHPRDPDTAWFVPAVKDECRVPVDGRFVATRTRDGGKSFDVLASGLPKPPAYDLVYRHALVVGDDGDTLAMGSTTGGLWTSADGGDRWELVSAHLPPIYALRFAH